MRIYCKLLIFSFLSAIIMESCNTPKAVTTASGLEYTITKKGDGIQPQVGDRVFVHYRGKFTNDSVFDESYKRGEPIDFELGRGQVIKGWDEGIALMHVGDKAVFKIPPHIAYGSDARGSIPANSTLIFDVELMKVIKKPQPFDVTGKDTVKLPSGLEYVKVKENPSGVKVSPNGIVGIHYAGYLKNGQLFDNSIERDQTLDFPVGERAVVPGFDEAVQQLKVGEKARFFIPYQLAYGDREVGPIPAKSDLIFDVEIITYKVKQEPVPFDVAGKDTLTTASGLKYIIIEQGNGPRATALRRVKVHYTGYLEDGKKFDSSISRGKPFQFELGVGQVIKGWDEGVALLNQGGKARLIVPYQLGYGEAGYPPVIPAKATLIFDVELIEIQ